MTALARPQVSLRHRLLAAGVELLPSQVVQPGRVMWWRGRKSLGFSDLADAWKAIPPGADAAWLAREDYEREVEH